ncbi:Protein of unknown function [Halobacillus dabanensis]|uniref:DUF3055 domain-containing protein n=1 Tax=Halobacillus dabanensis TaxID=240302 RepID=A0A1I3R5X0_HALDA|nr:DUF3055 domain-containing protein [Halobacillus dabanensis]SFJ40747.1 Protein of unknown function [Halobacillus dabanensis]
MIQETGDDEDMAERPLLEDITQSTSTRFVSFTAGSHRFELALMKADYFNNQTMVINLPKNRQALLDHEAINRDGHLEHMFQLSAMEAEELRNYLPYLL